jgi:hypothetical protein
MSELGQKYHFEEYTDPVFHFQIDINTETTGKIRV